MKRAINKFLMYANNHPNENPQKSEYPNAIKAPFTVTVYPMKY
jgi:hypothetical protein